MFSDQQTTVAQLRQLVEQFVAQRQWERYHSPKNLVMALAVESAELMEHFQWLDDSQSWAMADESPDRQEVIDEMADVLGYLCALANVLKVDLAAAVEQKMQKNVSKYPAEQFRGRWSRP